MSRPDSDPLLGASCVQLRPDVADKYFAAPYLERPFDHVTAKAICGRCAVQAACLEDAITSTADWEGSGDHVRGGVSGYQLRELRLRHRDGERAYDLTWEAIDNGLNKYQLGRIATMRAGEMPDAELLG